MASRTINDYYWTCPTLGKNVDNVAYRVINDTFHKFPCQPTSIKINNGWTSPIVQRSVGLSVIRSWLNFSTFVWWNLASTAIYTHVGGNGIASSGVKLRCQHKTIVLTIALKRHWPTPCRDDGLLGGLGVIWGGFSRKSRGAEIIMAIIWVCSVVFSELEMSHQTFTPPGVH